MRKFIIGQLTQSSTWFGLIIILCALLLPHTYILFVGIIIMLMDDARLQRFFAVMRNTLEKWWIE